MDKSSSSWNKDMDGYRMQMRRLPSHPWFIQYEGNVPKLYEWSFQRRSVTGLECVSYIIRHNYKILWPKATLVSIRSNSLLESVAWRGQKTESGLQMWQNH